MIKEIINELKRLYAFWSALMLLINYLAFIANLNPNDPNYMFQILGFLIASQVESMLLTALTALVLEFLKGLRLPL